MWAPCSCSERVKVLVQVQAQVLFTPRRRITTPVLKWYGGILAASEESCFSASPALLACFPLGGQMTKIFKQPRVLWSSAETWDLDLRCL